MVGQTFRPLKWIIVSDGSTDGTDDIVTGLVSFMLTCSFGALANVGTASFLFKRHTFWVLSALAGIVVGTVWNYAMTATYAWEKHWPKSNSE